MKRIIILIIVLVLPCCETSPTRSSSDTNNDGATAGGSQTKQLKTFGEPCDNSADCATGLCVKNDYAPFQWCSAECTQDKEPCPADSEGTVGGWCTKMPDEFQGSETQICLPICKEIADCTGKSDQWTTCKEPSYKGNPLHSDVPGILVCSTPNVHGVEQIDPETCEGWDETQRAKSFFTQVGICKSYCEYLVTCGEVDYKTSNENAMRCCAYGCLLKTITANGTLDDIYDKKIKCYNNYFYANQGNPNVCSAHLEDTPGAGSCEKPPEDTRPQ